MALYFCFAEFQKSGKLKVLKSASCLSSCLLEGLKSPSSSRSATDRQTDRQTNKVTTITLLCMCTEG